MTNNIEKFKKPPTMSAEEVNALFDAENAGLDDTVPVASLKKPKSKNVITVTRGGKPVSFTTDGEIVSNEHSQDSTPVKDVAEAA